MDPQQPPEGGSQQQQEEGGPQARSGVEEQQVPESPQGKGRDRQGPGAQLLGVQLGRPGIDGASLAWIGFHRYSRWAAKLCSNVMAGNGLALLLLQQIVGFLI